MTRDLSKYLRSEDDGYIRITPEIKQLAEKLTSGANTIEEKARNIYEYIKEKNWFFSPAMPSPDLLDKDSLDCSAKHVLQASLNRSIGIPTRIALLECPIEGLMSSVENSKLPSWAKAISETVLLTISDTVKASTHYATEVFYNNKWNFMDATMNKKACGLLDKDKKKGCLSDKNVSSVLGCRKIGKSTDVTSNGVIISSAIKMLTDIAGLTGLTGKVEDDEDKIINILK